MSGRQATLNTGHCLIDTSTGQRRSRLASSIVQFGAPSDKELAAYAATDEPFALAGAFSIEGLSGPFVRAVHGSPSNVLGLSLPDLREMLFEVGVEITDLWRRIGRRLPPAADPERAGPGEGTPWARGSLHSPAPCSLLCGRPRGSLRSSRRKARLNELRLSKPTRLATWRTEGPGSARRAIARSTASLDHVVPPRHAQSRLEATAKRALGETDVMGDLSHALRCRGSLGSRPEHAASTGSLEVGRNSGASLSRASETNRPNAMKYASAIGIGE